MNWKKLAVLAVVALVLYFVIATPDRAAAFVDNALGMLHDAGESLLSFVTGIF